MLPKAIVNRDLALLASGRLVSQLGDRMYAIAVAWWILDRTGSSVSMGLVMVASILPGIVLGAFVGPLVDRWDRKAVLVAADLARAAVVGAVTVLSAAGALSVAQMTASAAIISIAAAFFDPSSQAIIPQIVAVDELPRANALCQLVGGLTTVAGPIAGGLAVGSFGFVWIFAANAASYFLSALLEAGMRARTDGADRREARFLDEMREGLGFLRERKPMMMIIAAVALAHFSVGCMTVGLPMLANSLLADGARSLGLLQGAMGLGIVCGALLAGRMGAKGLGEASLFARLASLGGAPVAIGLLSLLSVRIAAPYAAIMLLYGASVAGASIIWQSLLQGRAPREMMGRVFGVSALAGNGSLPLAYALFGFLLGRFPLAPLFIGFGAVFSLFGIAMLFAASRGIPGREGRRT